MIKQINSFILGAMLIFSVSAAGQQMQTLGDWDVHYNAFPSTFITADVAKTYGIQRSRYLGLINISILSSKDETALSKTVTVTARNLLGTTRELEVREIREQNAIYYIAEVPHRNEETYRFTVTIKDADSSQIFKFQQKFYVD